MNDITNLPALAIAVVVWVVYAVYVVRLIRNSGHYEDAQLRLQTMIAFIVPFLGALFVHFMFLATRAKEPKADRKFDRSEYSYDDGKALRGDKDE